MEPIIVLVGFLGAGKTTLLRRLIRDYLEIDCDPVVILNDYENADLDAQRCLEFLQPCQIQALSGSCICCTGVQELRNQVNAIEPRKKGITLIEANGTTDAVSLMEFLGVGVKDHFQPPVQVSVVDLRNWQKREFLNELEANQVQVSSLIFLNYSEDVESHRIEQVKEDILSVNPSAVFRTSEDFCLNELTDLRPSVNQVEKMDHQKSHWSSCSVPLPSPLSPFALQDILDALPKTILRVKGCTKLDGDAGYTYFEKTPADEEAMLRPYRGTLVSGPMLLVVGPGSDPATLKRIVDDASASFMKGSSLGSKPSINPSC